MLHIVYWFLIKFIFTYIFSRSLLRSQTPQVSMSTEQWMNNKVKTVQTTITTSLCFHSQAFISTFRRLQKKRKITFSLSFKFDCLSLKIKIKSDVKAWKVYKYKSNEIFIMSERASACFKWNLHSPLFWVQDEHQNDSIILALIEILVVIYILSSFGHLLNV